MVNLKLIKYQAYLDGVIEVDDNATNDEILMAIDDIKDDEFAQVLDFWEVNE